MATPAAAWVIHDITAKLCVFKWVVVRRSPDVNGMRSHRIVMNRLIISEMLDWMTGALEGLWFVAHL